MHKYLEINPIIARAIANNEAVVCLESTIISHGMPYPENYQTAIKCEEEVRKTGAIPATIAIINGVVKVGLTNDEIEYIAKLGHAVIKTSRRDLPFILSQNKTGATTVSATMYAASLAGIKVFATGGIGGVHRGAEKSFDISADLEELANTDVCCVCAGAKAILDLGLTLEVLETKGVPVIGYKTSTLPAFYSSKSPHIVNYQIDTPAGIAELLHAKWKLRLSGGVLVCNPIPQEYSLDYNEMEQVVTKAIKDMDELNIKGKDATPYLLSRVSELTEGESLNSNIALVLNNCRLAGQIAMEYVKKA